MEAVQSRILDQIQNVLDHSVIRDRRHLDDEQLVRSEQLTVLDALFNQSVREAELRELSSHFAPLLRGSEADHPCHLAVWAKTGTGKMLTISYFLNLLSRMCRDRSIPMRHLHLDLSTSRPCFLALNDLACLFNASKRYKKGLSLDERMLRIEQALKDYRGCRILFVNEVDHVRRDSDTFFTFLVRRLPQAIPARLILVFASNRLDCRTRMPSWSWPLSGNARRRSQSRPRPLRPSNPNGPSALRTPARVRGNVRLTVTLLVFLASAGLRQRPAGAATTQPADPAASICSTSSVWVMRRKLSPEEYRAMQPQNRGPGPRPPGAASEQFPYVHAELDFEGKTYGNVALRYKGNSSFRVPGAGLKRPFHVDINRLEEGQTFHGLSAFNLNNNAMDPSQMRESLAYAVFHDAGVPAPRTAYVAVYLYVHPETRKIIWIPWDLNEAFTGFIPPGPPDTQMDMSIWRPCLGRNRLVERVLAIPRHRQAYREHLQRLITTCFSPQQMGVPMAATEALIRQAIRDDKQGPAATRLEPPDRSFDNLVRQKPAQRPFVTRRVESVTTRLEGKSERQVLRPQFGPVGAPSGLRPGAAMAERLLKTADAPILLRVLRRTIARADGANTASREARWRRRAECFPSEHLDGEPSRTAQAAKP